MSCPRETWNVADALDSANSAIAVFQGWLADRDAEITRLRGLVRDAHQRRGSWPICTCGERVPNVDEFDPRTDEEIKTEWHAAHVRSLTREPE